MNHAVRIRPELVLVTTALLWALPGCTEGGGTRGDAELRQQIPGVDSDGDRISDEDEGSDTRVDTDGDGTPDYLDFDSDGDGIPDFDEAGDLDLDTPPRDSDMDGTPDFRDLDSDDNGYPDSVEGTGDYDADGIPDFADLDDDNDLVPDAEELDGVLYPPLDTDGDGSPNYRDPDSDNDTILDGDEFGVDTDNDGLEDQEDLDSDNDGWLDSEEAGDQDIFSEPVDSDDDGIPDFRDPDSDNDGLSDRNEREIGSDPTKSDTDDDGVTDLIEVGAETDPTDGTVSPLTRGDFVFVIPYEEEPSPPRDTLRFRTSIQFADVYFLFDISGSMNVEIGALRAAVTTISNDLSCEDFGTACSTDRDCLLDEVCSLTGTCIEDPSSSSCVASAWTGGGIYEAEFENLLSVQPDPARTSSALSVSTFGSTENLYGAVWGVADPSSAPISTVGCIMPTPERVGCPGFREEAVKILVAFTDERGEGTQDADLAGAAAALQRENITLIGVWSGTPGASGRDALETLVRESGSFSGAGEPLMFDGQDAAVVPAVVDAINEVVKGVPLRVTIQATDEPGDAGNALQFIDHLAINVSGGPCSIVSPTEDTDGDGRDDAFPSLLPGTPVCWDVVPRQNDTVMATTRPQVFRARITVSGDDSPLDSRVVYFLIPPVIEDPGGPI